ncbi:MAG: hypothetical protein HW390_1361 [Candidatus Brocadiaceae bacterium]|nr:hypothetical protein [Candidatus Brocadiaceae bacterium]
MKKRFFGLLLLSVISMPFSVKGAFAEHAEKSYKSWTNSIYVYTGLGESVDIIDPVKMEKIGTIPGIDDIHNCFTSYDGTSLYISAGNEIVKVSFKGKKGGGEIQRNGITAGELAHVALTRDGKNLYISDGKDNVLVVDANTLKVTKTINMPTGLDDVIKIVKDELGKSWDVSDSNPHGLAVHPGGRYVYVPLVWSGAVAVIDTTTNEVIKTLYLNASNSSQPGHGTTPVALGFSTEGHWCFVSCAVPGYECILNTSDPANPQIETTVAVGLSPIQVPSNPTNKYFIAPCQTSSLLDNKASTVPDPVFNNAEWINWINTNKNTALDLVEALFSALHDAEPMEPNDDKPDACFVVEIDDNYDHDGISWEVISIVEAGVGPHGVSYTPGGEFAFVTLSNEIPGKVAVIAETESGEFKVIHTIKVGKFPNGISIRFGKSQNS